MKFSDYVKAGVPYVWVLPLVIVTSLIGTAVISAQTPEAYSSSALVRFSSPDVAAVPWAGTGSPEAPDLRPYIEILGAESFKEAAVKAVRENPGKTQMTLSRSHISAESLGNSDLLKITVEAESPEAARSLADEAVNTLVEKSRELEESKSAEYSGVVSAKLGKYEQQLLELKASERKLLNLGPDTAKAISKAGGDPASSLATVRFQIERVESVRRIWNDYLAEASLSESLGGQKLQPVYAGSTPKDPVRPNLASNLLIGGSVSVFFAFGLMALLARRLFDATRVKSKGD